jgi:hypothetical protein
MRFKKIIKTFQKLFDSSEYYYWLIAIAILILAITAFIHTLNQIQF